MTDTNKGRDTPNVISIVGRSKRGKTTFLKSIIPLLKKKGYTICVIKHSTKVLTHTDFDREGKDTYHFSEAGADEVWLASPCTTYHLQNKEVPLTTMITMSPADFIFTEGFKKADTPKIVIKTPGEHIDVSGDILLTIEGDYNPEKIVDMLIHS
jgi:molybdopterin-guanine dinucleotide biosynthesis protein B